MILHTFRSLRTTPMCEAIEPAGEVSVRSGVAGRPADVRGCHGYGAHALQRSYNPAQECSGAVGPVGTAWVRLAVNPDVH